MIVIFPVYIFSRIFKKRKLSENIYNANISTFTVYKIEVEKIAIIQPHNHCVNNQRMESVAGSYRLN